MSQALKKIPQKRFIKGVVASAVDFAQPQGSIPRGSNLLMTKRGGLVTCDGSSFLTVYNSFGAGGQPQPASGGFGPITELFLFQPAGLPATYFGIIKDPTTVFGTPTGLAVVDGGAGGVLTGTYSWYVTALDGAGGETVAAGPVNFTAPASHKANVSWTVTPLAVGYNVYRTAVGPTNPPELLNATPITTNSYVDNIADGARIVQGLPTFDTTQVTRFYNLILPVYAMANSIFTFPADLLAFPGGGIGGYGGGGLGGGTSGSQPPTPSGGVVGNISPIPQIVQFANVMILALGNGIAPYQSDGTTPNTIVLANTFTATYPARANSTAQAKGDLITVTVGGTAYIFRAIQGGVTAAGAPTFPAGLNVTVADGSVIWQNIGVVGTNPAPRGAAHAIVYAGSLWLYNTSPTNTADNFDGPSCLKMSDTNNPTSWNPLNVAFLDKDDGSQGMGLAVFTIAEAGISPTGSLVAFKEFSTFQIIGVFGSSSFSIQRAQTDMGCVAPRTIQFVPGFGIVRLTHLGIAVFDGVRDRLLSEEIRPFIFGGLSDIQATDWNFVWNSRASLTASPPMYVCAVPILPPTTFLSLTVNSITSATLGINLGTIPPGTYYAILYMLDAQGNFHKSAEFGPITLTSGQVFAVVIPILPTTGVQYFLAYGPTPGGENKFIFIKPEQLPSVSPIANYFISPGVTSKVPFTSAGMLTRLLCYDLVLKGWIIVDLPFAICTLKQIRTPGTIPITIMGGFTDMAVRRWQVGDPLWDTGATTAGAADRNIHYSMRSPEVFGQGASDRVYFRRLSIRGVGNPTGLTATLTTNGLAGAATITQNFTVQLFGTNEFVAYTDLAITCMNAYVKLSGVAATQFEIDSLDWSYMPKPVGGLVAVG